MPFYWRLSAYYFFYFASIGAFVPYWGLYLQERGFSALAIGQLIAIVALTKVLAPYVWGWLADFSGQRIRMVRYASCTAAVIFAGVFAASDFFWLALVMFLFSFFWNAGLPQFEATTLNFLGDQHHRYSTIRSWGSIGFIVTVLGVGALLDRYGLQILPATLLLLYVGIWLSTLLAPAEKGQHRHADGERSIWHVLKQRPVQLLLLASFLLQLSFGPYYTFFSIYLEAEGFSKSSVGFLWVLGVLAEIVVFMLMHRVLLAYGARRLLLWCFALACVRWLLIGFAVNSLALLLFAQILHAFTFGMVHAVMIHLVHRFFSGVHQGRGQALYSSLSFGAGAALGSLLSGYFWEDYGAAFCFTLAAGVAAIGFLVLCFADLPSAKRTEGEAK